MVRNQVEAAYARSDLFERRRVLMDDWATYLAGERGQVVPLRREPRATPTPAEAAIGRTRSEAVERLVDDHPA